MGVVVNPPFQPFRALQPFFATSFQGRARASSSPGSPVGKVLGTSSKGPHFEPQLGHFAPKKDGYLPRIVFTCALKDSLGSVKFRALLYENTAPLTFRASLQLGSLYKRITALSESSARGQRQFDLSGPREGLIRAELPPPHVQVARLEQRWEHPPLADRKRVPGSNPAGAILPSHLGDTYRE